MKKLIAVMAAGALAMCMFGCSGESTEGEATQEGSSDQAVEEAQPSYFGIGDTATVDGIDYTLVSVELTDERNQFADTDPAAVVKITYTMKNNTDSEASFGMDCDVYDAAGKKCDTYPNEMSMGSVAAGKAVDAVIHYGLSETGEIEIQFKPIVSMSDAAIFKATV